MRFSEQSQASLFFLRKYFACTKSQIKPKPIIQASMREKLLPLFAYFDFFGRFDLICVFVRAKYFSEKKTGLGGVLISSLTISFQKTMCHRKDLH